MNRGRPRIYWSGVWLAVALVGIKATYLGAPSGYSFDALQAYTRSLAAISYRDVAAAAVFWALARMAPARLSVIWPWVFAELAIYSALNVAAFHVLGGPITYPLLLTTLRSPMLMGAITSCITPRVGLALVVLGVGFLAAVAVSVRISNGRERSHRIVAGLVAAVLLVAWCAEGQWAFDTKWNTKADWQIAENAYAVFLLSGARKLSGERTVSLPAHVDPADLADFEPLGGRVAPQPQTTGAPPLNVVLVVLESVGARWTGLNGGPYDTTPHLVAESSHALVFDNMYSHIGRSSNALVAMLFSAFPKLDFIDITSEYPRLQRTPLASLFHDRGYRTAFITSSDLAWAGWNTFLQGRGFDEILDYHSLMCGPLLSEWGVEDRCLVDATIQFIEKAPGQPFFLMDWTTQTHYPYEPTPDVPMLNMQREPSPDQWDLNRYLNTLHETDRHLARIFDALRRTGLDRNTLVVLVGDHGQAFGYPHASYGQGQTAYEEDVHVPLMLWSPGAFPQGARSKTIGSQVDLAPTIAELAGVPPAADWQGRSLLASGRAPRAYFYVAEDRFILGVRENNWKYLFDLRQGLDELYDLDHDPNEQHNVVLDEPDRATRLRGRLAAWLEQNGKDFKK